MKDLREFIRRLEKDGNLKRISKEVDPILELTELTDRVCKANGPALLFENVKGSPVPLAINLFGSYRRIKLALEVEDLNEIACRIDTILEPQLPASFLEKLKSIPKLNELLSFTPKQVRSGPCKEVRMRDNPSLYKFPIMKCWPQDGGRFITLPLVFTKDPETERRNVGIYRMQVFDEKTTGMHWHPHKDGARHYEKYERLSKRMEVAVALGADPATIYAASSPLPYGIDEMLFSGFLRRESVEMVKCETIDLDVPAYSEIVFEGYIEPGERRLEGPFGDHTGFYSLAKEFPVFHITCITHRKDPIYPATIVGRPPMEDCFLAKATERIFLPLIKRLIPEIVDINLPIEGVFHNCAIVSIDKSYPGQARKVVHALWGLGQFMFTKVIIVVESDINIQDTSELSWKAFNNIDPKRDVFFADGPVDILDHASPYFGYGSKMGIDATIKTKEEGALREWPSQIKMDEKIKELIDKNWASYGI